MDRVGIVENGIMYVFSRFYNFLLVLHDFAIFGIFAVSVFLTLAYLIHAFDTALVWGWVGGGCLVLGTWFWVLGFGFLVLGSWFLVLGFW